MDIITLRRLKKWVNDHRHKTGQFPTLRDFEQAGFDKELVEAAVRQKHFIQLYLTLTNGTVVKGYKCKE